MSKTVFFHVDMDAFYASVEQNDNPEYRDKPVIVGARPGHRGVVSACSYEARVFGVHSAMPISQAYRLCPTGIFLPVRMERYHQVSTEIMDLLAEFTPELAQMSVDEAFLDLSGTERLFGDPQQVARTIKNSVREKTGLTISVGVAPSRFLAKLASDKNKPDGLCVVKHGEEAEFVARLPLRSLWGVGKKMLATLEARGIHTVTQLREYEKSELASFFGNAAAHYLHSVSRGVDPGLYGPGKSHSISGERTFSTDVRDPEVIYDALLEIASSCAFRLREENAQSRTATFKLRLSDFTTTTASRTLDHEIMTSEELYEISRGLLEQRWDKHASIRLVGCGFSNVVRGKGSPQGELFSDDDQKSRQVEEAVYRLSKQGLTVKRARLLRGHKEKSP
ncbi:MAG: DNA polymerase IV [Spirochaetota bacterium]